MKRIVLFTLTVLLSFGAYTAQAQIETPSPSPGSYLKQTVGLTTIEVEYSRPSVKGRQVFGTATEQSLEKYDKPWRTGANTATKFTFSNDLKINGKNLAKGAYSILTMPGVKEWTVMFFPYDSGSWTYYTDKTPVLQTKVAAQDAGRKVETFAIDINNISNESATIDLIWDNVLVSIPIKVEVDSRVMAAIDKAMAGPSSDDYYAAASYYHDAGKDLAQALVWIRKANSDKDDQKFWMVRKEAQILADMGNYKAAIEAANRSKDLAEKADYEPYIRMNEESIREWTKMMK